MEKDRWITIITGHYGSGKTNLAVNLALDAKKSGQPVTVIDLDIVNPYFRTADFSKLFSDEGIEIIAPVYANTNLDIPALSGAVDGVLRQKKGVIIIDVGGDDAGAIALGRYSEEIRDVGYELIYVINCYRYLTKNPEDALTVMREIEAASGLRATKLFNNSNLGKETDGETVLRSIPFAEECETVSGVPLWATAVESRYADELSSYSIYPVTIYVGPNF